MPDVKTPFGGIPRWAVYGMIIGGGGGLIYAYVKKKNKAATASTANTGANVYGYGTGGSYGYGSGQYGYGAYTYQPYGYGYGPSGLGSYPGGTYGGYGYYGAGVPVQVPPQASTNAQWTQAALSALTAQGYTGQQVLGAVSPYLSGKPLTTDQTAVVQAAIAVEGYPPVAGPGGFPPAIQTGGSGGGGGQTSPVTVPKLAGLTVNNGQAILRELGLRTQSGPGTSGYIITSTNPPAGASVAPNTVITINSKK